MKKNNLPSIVLTVEQIKILEKEYIKSIGITLFDIMQRAGRAAFNIIKRLYPQTKYWLILCGNGNNGGDGYIIGSLAQIYGINVWLLTIENEKKISIERTLAKKMWLTLGGKVHPFNGKLPGDNIDLIIDCLLGTGLNKAPGYPYNKIIINANQYHAPIIGIDVPSGLLADTGATPGVAIKAVHTITFISLKPGLLTGQARKYVGQLHYHSLEMDLWLNKRYHHSSIKRIEYNINHIKKKIISRSPISHKGKHGKLLLIGGDIGMAGAIILAGEAALRTGTGLVKILTHKYNILPILSARPELIVQEFTIKKFDFYLNWSNTIIIGPGLGQEKWAKDACQKLKISKKNMLWDADALTNLAKDPNKCNNRIITPHPGEAARLLNLSIKEIENNRVQTAKILAKKYGGVVVLKGAGTIIASYKGQLTIADVGNVGLASAGMGDILSGIIGSFIGDNFSLYESACLGCVIHGKAADYLAKKYGTRGILARDILSVIYKFLTPKFNNN
ncbi:MAG: NAD(P)H-hydrate dehydratase [Candidatus Dasytiphilus stammeri]